MRSSVTVSRGYSSRRGGGGGQHILLYTQSLYLHMLLHKLSILSLYTESVTVILEIFIRDFLVFLIFIGF